MKQFTYAVDVSALKLSDEEKALFAKENGKQVFENILAQAINQKSPQGIPGPIGRTLVRILNKLDASTDGNIQLEETEFEFIKGFLMNDAILFRPAQYRLIALYQANLDGAKSI